MWQRIRNWFIAFISGAVAAVLLYLGLRKPRVPTVIEKGTETAQKKAQDAIAQANEALAKSQQVVAESQTVLEAARKRRQARQERARRLDGGGGSLLTIIFLALLVILYTGTVHAQETVPVPESYDDLRAAYLEQVKLAAQWRELYQEAEADNLTLENEIERLQNHIKYQDEIIASLRDTIKELKDWIAELYKTIADLSRRGLKMTVGALFKADDGKISADGVIVGVTWP